MSVNISTNARNLAGAAIIDLINIGTVNPNGFMEIRSGVKPSSPQSAATGTLLATLSFSNPAFGAFSNGTSIANSISPDTNVDNNGVAGWFRVYNRDGAAIFDGDISATGGGGDMEFDNINFLAGGTVQITSLNAIMPQ